MVLSTQFACLSEVQSIKIPFKEMKLINDQLLISLKNQ